MNIKAQNGITYDVCELQQHRNETFGILKENGYAKLLGKFDGTKRACEVMAEATLKTGMTVRQIIRCR